MGHVHSPLCSFVWWSNSSAPLNSVYIYMVYTWWACAGAACGARTFLCRFAHPLALLPLARTPPRFCGVFAGGTRAALPFCARGTTCGIPRWYREGCVFVKHWRFYHPQRAPYVAAHFWRACVLARRFVTRTHLAATLPHNAHAHLPFAPYPLPLLVWTKDVAWHGSQQHLWTICGVPFGCRTGWTLFYIYPSLLAVSNNVFLLPGAHNSPTPTLVSFSILWWTINMPPHIFG